MAQAHVQVGLERAAAPGRRRSPARAAPSTGNEPARLAALRAAAALLPARHEARGGDAHAQVHARLPGRASSHPGMAACSRAWKASMVVVLETTKSTSSWLSVPWMKRSSWRPSWFVSASSGTSSGWLTCRRCT